MQQSNNQELYIILFLGVLLVTSLAAFILYFIILYKNKQFTHKQEQKQLKATFDQELLKTQIEVQDQTLHHISQEIHDNITQVLSFVKLNLALTDNLSEGDKTAKIKESRELIAQTIYDLRDLSKSLSFEQISSLGLVKTIEIESSRINKSGIINIDVWVDGEVYDLGDQYELVLFRIVQEALNNTLKHSNAKHLKISLQYSNQLFNLTVEDDGAGFSADALKDRSGLGLKNMENRAALIGGSVIIDSAPGKGCRIKVNLIPLKRLHADGTYPDSFS